MSIEASFDGIAVLIERVVDEEPHPDPAIGSLHHVIDDDPSGRVSVPHVVLHVEASLGKVSQRQANDEGLAPVTQQAEAGQAWMLIGWRTEELAQPGRREALECRRNSARIVGPGSGGAS